ncbi:MMB_0454 family protein [Mycoplasmopsis felifaucium]|uniref:MMB_0454 family protein n=1 Tax=Mycoplasmopsis felifaucium TaxID=35768 RepID=UPI000480A53B|nr:hypothetical protein [Mycoplasmopsis felifaucium]
MNLLTVYCGISESFSVTENAIQELLNIAIAENKNIKIINEPRIIFLEDRSNVSIIIDVKVKRNASLKETLDNLRSDIISKYENLVGFEPKNLKICFVGNY